MMYKIKGRKILVTGGAGNIGSHIVDMLVKEEAKEITIIDDFTRGRKENIAWAKEHGNIRFIDADIRDIKMLKKEMQGIDYVFHMAAIRITQCQEDPRYCHEVLAEGTFNVFEAAVSANVKKVVFASSASVYGEPSKIPMDEDHPFNNDTFYGACKIANEYLAIAFRKKYGMNYVGLRYFNVYGPRMDIYGYYTEVMIKWLDRIDKGEAPIIFGDGKQAMDFVFIEDVARATVLALKSDKNEGFYNIGTGVITSLNELARKMLDLTKPDLNPEYKKSDKAIIVSRRKAGINKAKKDLGFTANIDVKEGLKRLVEWRKKELKNG